MCTKLGQCQAGSVTDGGQCAHALLLSTLTDPAPHALAVSALTQPVLRPYLRVPPPSPSESPARVRVTGQTDPADRPAHSGCSLRVIGPRAAGRPGVVSESRGDVVKIDVVVKWVYGPKR
jgi:hypothetical protein